MYQARGDELFFFEGHMAALPLYEALAGELFARFPDTALRAQKTQLTFSDRHVYACVSFARVRRKAELPAGYLVVTLGLPAPLNSPRVAVQTEPYPGRWTHHLVLSAAGELDGEFWSWVTQAHDFARSK